MASAGGARGVEAATDVAEVGPALLAAIVRLVWGGVNEGLDD